MDNNEIFTLFIPDDGGNKLTELAYLSLKSFLLCDYEVILYTYDYLDNVPNGVCVRDANEILNSSKVFRYKGGFKTYSGFANLFRYARLYEYGGTWMDLDMLLIKRIPNENIIICSQTQEDIYSSPNNAILRFPAKDPLVKTMLEFALKRGDEVTHGETGPLLVRKMLNTTFVEYNKYLKHFNFSNVVNWNDVDDYTKNPDEFLGTLNSDEIFGFHLFNTFFKNINEFPKDSFFHVLKNIILNSHSHEEYYSNLIKFNIIRFNSFESIINWDLKYLNVMNDIFLKDNVKYTFLIDSRYLKKVEIYNIIHSIFNSYRLNYGKERIISDIQVLIFGKTDMGNDKIKFKENISILGSDFKDIKNYLNDYIYGEHIIPLDKPVVFKLDFFKDRNVSSDIEIYALNDHESHITFFNKDSYNFCLRCGVNIFNMDPNTLKNFDFDTYACNEDLVHIYNIIPREILKLIMLIEICDVNSFLKVKSELLKYNISDLMNELSFHYVNSYENIINSENYGEFNLKEYATRLNCLNAFYMNKINNRYGF